MRIVRLMRTLPPAPLVAAGISEIVSDPKARRQLTPNNFPTQAKA